MLTPPTLPPASARRNHESSRRDAAWLADSIGCRVPRADFAGRVEAVFANACHVLHGDGGLIALLSLTAGNVAHGIRLRSDVRFDHELVAGMPVLAQGRRLAIGGSRLVELACGRTWAPDPLPPIAAGAAARAGDRLRGLLLRRQAHSESEFLAAALGTVRPLTPLGSLLATQLPALAAATRACDQAACAALLAGLVGLGPGLTPAGDDFIIGWLAGLALRAQGPERLRFLEAARAETAALGARTCRVSRAHLEDACALAFSERLSDLCLALARGLPAPEFERRLHAQLAVGASSGADAAAGLLLALGGRA